MDGRPGDEMLLAAVTGRDMGAFRTLYERHAGRQAIRPSRRCNDRDLVADADPAASVSWRTGTGRYRNVGARVRDGAGPVEPSPEDAYLLLRGGAPEPGTAGEVAS